MAKNNRQKTSAQPDDQDWAEEAAAEIAAAAPPALPPSPDEVAQLAADAAALLAATAPQVQQNTPPALPDGLNESFAMLAEAKAMPSRTPAEKLRRHKAVWYLKRHCFAIQQGLPVYQYDADDQAVEESTERQAIRKRTAIQVAAQGNPLMQELLASHDKLTATAAAAQVAADAMATQ